MRYFLALIVLVTASGCGHSTAFIGEPSPMYSSPDEAGFDADSLAALTAFIKDTPTTGMVVLYKGQLLYEYGDIKRVSYIASCRKSVLSMLYGSLVEDGTVDLNQTIGDLGVDEKGGLLPIEKKATVDHILNSRSGVFHEASNGGYDRDNFLERGSVEPGKYWVYNNWDFNVGGHLLEVYTGRSIYEELEDQLAIPLGFQDWDIKNQKKSGKKRKSQYPAYHIYLSTRDMAKIGQLMLNEGMWNGEQLIPAAWVRRTTTTVTPHETLLERYGEPDPALPAMSYSYMWWLLDSFKDKNVYDGAYTAIGYGGQYITVIPKMDMVIALKTKLNLFTMIGITYKATDGPEYFEMMDRLVRAKNE